MNIQSILLLAAVLVWFVYALIRSIRKKGCGCGCGGGSACGGSCAHCSQDCPHSQKHDIDK